MSQGYGQQDELKLMLCLNVDFINLKHGSAVVVILVRCQYAVLIAHAFQYVASDKILVLAASDK